MWADKGWDLLMETCPHTKYLDSKLELGDTLDLQYVSLIIGVVLIFFISTIKVTSIFYHLSKSFFSINIFPVRDIARENLCSALTDGRSTPTNKHSCHKLPVCSFTKYQVRAVGTICRKGLAATLLAAIEMIVLTSCYLCKV